MLARPITSRSRGSNPAPAIMKNKMSFSEKCYEILRKIPRGKVTTYKAIAEALGTKAYRAVGVAMKQNPDIINTPCHRVVNSDGRVGGYSKGMRMKISLLKGEGIKVENKKIKEFTLFFSYPSS